MARHHSPKNYSSRSSRNEYSASPDDASNSTVSNDCEALVPIASASQAIAISNEQDGVSLWPPGFNFSTDVTHGDIVHQPDGSHAMSWATNAERTSCAYCDRPFRNRAKMEEHQRDNTRPCYVCHQLTLWCRDGVQQFRSRSCGPWSCMEHRRCFYTHKTAMEHAMAQSHTSCFFPRCADVMAIGPRDRVEVHYHMWDKHKLAGA
jgi:hypothetical protein